MAEPPRDAEQVHGEQRVQHGTPREGEGKTKPGHGRNIGAIRSVSAPYIAGMHLTDYQELAARTLGRDRTHEQQLANAALGLTGEAGETAEIIKKHLFHATPINRDALVKELGDCLWYIAAFATVLEIPLDEIAQRNIDKLRARYPEGFDTERSRNRVE